MATEISLKEEYFSNSDEATLQAVLRALSEEFLLIQLDDYRIEVNDRDVPALSKALDELKRDIDLNAQRQAR